MFARSKRNEAAQEPGTGPVSLRSARPSRVPSLTEPVNTPERVRVRESKREQEGGEGSISLARHLLTFDMPEERWEAW